MGLLDGVLGNLMGGQQSGGANPLLQIAMQLLQQQSQSSGGTLGGLMDAFQKAGMGEQLNSWIGTGQNIPATGDQMTQALGRDKIADIARQLGMSHGEVSGGLADMLPQLIDKITPDGQLPQDHNMLQDALSAFLKR